MRKKIALVAVFTALLAMVATSIPALARSEVSATAETIEGQALVIRAPEVAPPGEETTITVFDRQTTEPVEGVGVWVVPWNNARKLKADIAGLPVVDSASEQELKTLIDSYAESLGLTDEYGQVVWTPERAGYYLLVAVKEGYIPGFTSIHARKIVRALSIRAPRVVPVGEETAITVYDRWMAEPVVGAGVWLLSREQAAELRGEIAALHQGNAATAAADVNYESLISLYVESLGLTDDNGQVFWTPEETGNYTLVAIKDGYIPAFAPINAAHITGNSARSLNSNGGLKQTNMLRSVNTVRSENSPNSPKGKAIRTRVRSGQADSDTVLP